MKIPAEYSIVVFPTPEQSELVKSYKQLLKSKIGWFGSVDSAAHITLIELKNDLELSLYIDTIREFCKTLVPKEVTFNSWDKFEHAGALYIAPDSDSKFYLDTLIINLNEYLGFKIDNANVNSHMSIGRKIFGDRMETAEELFKNIEMNIKFNCDTIWIRKFNGKQYADIVEKITFEK